MDDLELLKKDWNKEKPDKYPQYTEEKLFQMTKKKSVSTAKWIFIVGAIELLFWMFYNYRKNIDRSVIAQVMFLLFLMTSYIQIYTGTSARKLMKSILQLKNGVVIYTIYMFVSQIGIRYEKLKMGLKKLSDGDISMVYFLGMITGVCLFLYLLYLFYKKTYDKFLKQMKQNYNDLNSQIK